MWKRLFLCHTAKSGTKIIKQFAWIYAICRLDFYVAHKKKNSLSKPTYKQCHRMLTNRCEAHSFQLITIKNQLKSFLHSCQLFDVYSIVKRPKPVVLSLFFAVHFSPAHFVTFLYRFFFSVRVCLYGKSHQLL